MRMSILELSYKNIRRISDLSLSFNKKNTFLMMGNGTGKTTTMDLIKGLLDSSASSWDEKKVKDFAPISNSSEKGEFKIKVKFDNSIYIYKLTLDYVNGSTKIETTTTGQSHGGEEQGLKLPESLKGIFTPEFVRRFVFDGEQAIKTLDSSSNEAEETIKYLYRLDELDEILAANEKILSDIQNAEGKPGTEQSLKGYITKRNGVKETIEKLEKRRDDLQNKARDTKEKLDKLKSERRELDENNRQLNEEKREIEKDEQINRSKIESDIKDILNIIKNPYKVSKSMCESMLDLGNNMTKLKLPKASSKDFFVELSNAEECICGRHIGKEERECILNNAEKYLGSEKQAVLNELKNSLNNCIFDNSLAETFNNLSEQLQLENRILARKATNEDKLLKAGGDRAISLQQQIEQSIEDYGRICKDLSIIESKDLSDESLTELNNLNKAMLAAQEYDEKIASATKTSIAYKKKMILEGIIAKIKRKATDDLKASIIEKTNEKIKEVITDDPIEIEDIDKYIKLMGRTRASDGQTLSIAYCFLGTLFEDSELEFPFIIDSPAGSMDFEKRKAVADIIPTVFNQLIAFVTSSEVENFADRFYDSEDSQFVTIIANPNNESVEVHMGKDFFNTYQRENRED